VISLEHCRAISRLLDGGRAAADHHLYYRAVNRAAGIIAGAITAWYATPDTVARAAEDMISDLESSMGGDLLGYGGRPLFPALRKRVAETLVEMGY